MPSLSVSWIIIHEYAIWILSQRHTKSCESIKTSRSKWIIDGLNWFKRKVYLVTASNFFLLVFGKISRRIYNYTENYKSNHKLTITITHYITFSDGSTQREWRRRGEKERRERSFVVVWWATHSNFVGKSFSIKTQSILYGFWWIIAFYQELFNQNLNTNELSTWREKRHIQSDRDKFKMFIVEWKKISIIDWENAQKSLEKSFLNVQARRPLNSHCTEKSQVLG